VIHFTVTLAAVNVQGMGGAALRRRLMGGYNGLMGLNILLILHIG
jgi:hypothetical protein